MGDGAMNGYWANILTGLIVGFVVGHFVFPPVCS
jgi:hypothetical protein